MNILPVLQHFGHSVAVVGGGGGLVVLLHTQHKLVLSILKVLLKLNHSGTQLCSWYLYPKNFEKLP